MNIKIDIQNFEKKTLSLAPSGKNTAWSYFNVYSLRDFRDIYNVIYKNSNVRSLSSLLSYCNELRIKSESGKAWSERNLLEIVNALKKTELLDLKSMEPLAGGLFKSDYNESLSIEDIQVLRRIFFSYFRFNDFISLFRNDNKGSVEFVVAYMVESRFFNNFAVLYRNTIYCIEDTKKNVMRFWDVFTKWGMALKVLNKCSLKALNIDCVSWEAQNGYLLNLTVPMPSGFSVLHYAKENFMSECIYIPDLERELILKYGFHIDDIKTAIVEECVKHSDLYRLQRITEIFIEQGERLLFPFVDGSYMSHILKIY